ncbi:hypothetical protein [Mycobacterium paragordonae]|uniref:Uncharacterized protein n=2 Tax=Mycobacterium TaxID=1763 RepID=A0AAJ1S9C5_9MYCO|nr:hypothetical protein [Mycobacterium paragordonae]MDP7739635.1 hypothetical protein [Mycobacterium paragordonae]PJE18015.1 MAG: hypothetical protein CK429_05175 [Mycobacterium sp.]
MSENAWLNTVERLCAYGFDPDGSATGGAQVQVFDRTTNTMVYRQPIARTVRLEPAEPLLWFRQIIGTGPAFDITECRRRSLSTEGATLEGERVIFPQNGMQTNEYAVITAADPDQIAVLDAWDTWKLIATNAEEETSLDHLNAD